MATLEDKLLGEKLDYYCSSSENEDNDDDDGDDAKKGGNSACSMRAPTDAVAAGGFRQQLSTNTGPKGVVKDWQMYKQLEAEHREETERQRIALAKKLTLTSVTAQEDEERRKMEELDAELAELMSEDFLQQYQKQRMAEMMRQTGHLLQFGKVQQLNTHEEYLQCVENENKHTTIIVHIFDRAVKACTTLNNCLDSLAADYPSVKFAKISIAVAGMSREFRNKGLPAVLAYKNKQLIGNFVRITDDLSDDFFPSDVESFLIEHGIVIDKSLHI